MSRIFILLSLAAATTAGLVGTGVVSYEDLASLVTSPGTSQVNAPEGKAAGVRAEVRKAAPERIAALPNIETSERARKQAPVDPGKPSFDIVRLDPDGFSVFAGKAMPDSVVTILANGRPIATTKASETGDWSVVVEHPFAAGEYQLTVTAKAGDQGTVVAGQTVSMAVAKGARVAAAPPVGKASAPGGVNRSVPGAGKEVAELERMVVSARSGGGAPGPAVSLPVPIRFVYNEANFTPEGRRAAALLAEYLQLRKLDNVVLTGHADERGSDEYNMELSQERLESVARFLRENGFSGRLELLPKGKSEPYRGVDRTAMPREQVYQLDRRVELHLKR